MLENQWSLVRYVSNVFKFIQLYQRHLQLLLSSWPGSLLTAAPLATCHTWHISHDITNWFRLRQGLPGRLSSKLDLTLEHLKTRKAKGQRKTEGSLNSSLTNQRAVFKMLAKQWSLVRDDTISTWIMTWVLTAPWVTERAQEYIGTGGQTGTDDRWQQRVSGRGN